MVHNIEERYNNQSLMIGKKVFFFFSLYFMHSILSYGIYDVLITVVLIQMSIYLLSELGIAYISNSGMIASSYWRLDSRRSIPWGDSGGVVIPVQLHKRLYIRYYQYLILIDRIYMIKFHPLDCDFRHGRAFHFWVLAQPETYVLNISDSWVFWSSLTMKPPICSNLVHLLPIWGSTFVPSFRSK